MVEAVFILSDTLNITHQIFIYYYVFLYKIHCSYLYSKDVNFLAKITVLKGNI